MIARRYLWLIFIFLLISCAPKIVSIYNHDLTNKTPVTFLVHPASEYTSLSAENSTLDNRLQKIIYNSLVLKGLKESALPDLNVSYMINVHTSSVTQQDNYSSYNRYNYNYPYNYSTRKYKEGVLIIDIKNNAGKLVWQGSKTFKIGSKQSIDGMLPDICREIISVYNITAEQ